MSNAAIYYKMTNKQDSEDVITDIEKVIAMIKKNNNIIGVYIDYYNHSDEFSNLLGQNFSLIDNLYLNKGLENEFDKKVINELARTERFNVVYFDEI